MNLLATGFSAPSAKGRRHRLSGALLACVIAGSAAPAWADQNTGSARFYSYFWGLIVDSPIPSLTETARLDFRINIEKMIYLRVGAGGSHSGGASGTGPADSGETATVSLNLTPRIPAGGTTPLPGNAGNANWNGGVPTLVAGAPVVLPVEVRSNSGQVKISGQVTNPLTSGGGYIIPMSNVSITSSDTSNLPAPVLVDSGAGAPVNVAPGGTGTDAAPTLLTYRKANWSFGFNSTAPLRAGVYSGSVTFTATSL